MGLSAAAITVYVVVVPFLDWDFGHPLLWATGILAVGGGLFAAVSIVRDRRV
jgi:hypothetical protein